jgi:uncharacterized OsmC-like protein
MFKKPVQLLTMMVMLGLLLLPASLLAAQEADTGAMTQLDPGDQHWYTLDYQGDGALEVWMDVEPAGGAAFMIVTPEAIRAWAAGEELQSIGRGTENKFDDADLSWSSSSAQAGTYHLVVEYAGNGQDSVYYSLEIHGASLAADTAEAGDEAAAGGEEATAEDEGAAAAEAQPAAAQLATASAVSRLSNQPGRAIVTARGNHFVVDSVPPLGGPNEEINPLDLLLGAQATCAAFVYETAAQEMGIPVTDISATVEGDFNPQGVADGSVNPRLRTMRVHMDLTGATEEQAAQLAEQFKTRCPMYTTMERALPIEITTGEKPQASVAEGLSTASATARVSNQPGRAIVTARGNHFVVDSVPPLGGPNEERNPLDLALGALATCGTFIYETAAEEMGIALTDISATVEGDFDGRGVADGSVNPRIQAFRVTMEAGGATAEQAEMLSQEFQSRCPIYTTLSRSAPIAIENITQ